MTLSAHIRQLEKRHRQLEDQLERISNKPGVKDAEINEIKREKLKVKDRIEALRRGE